MGHSGWKLVEVIINEKNLKLTLYISLLFWCNLLIAQNSLSPQVIGSQGASVTSGTGKFLQYTVGEAVIVTAQSSSHIITQGFNQPKTMVTSNPLNVYYTIQPANCFGIYNGALTLDSIIGCSGNYTVAFRGVVTTALQFDSLTATSYSLTVTSDDGCSWDENIIITSTGTDCELEFYNAFSPNGDLMNDLWIVENAPAYPDNVVQLFDRWGNKVWSVEGYNNTDRVWDGKNTKGTAMPNGTYFYIFQSGEAVFKGYVELTK